MILNYSLPCLRTAPRSLGARMSLPQGRPPRIARLLALAHRLDGLLKEGKVKRSRDLAHSGGVTATRVSQILVLVALAPDIQEYILFLSAGEGAFIHEARLRTIARQPLWERQREMFEQLRADARVSQE